MPSSSKSSAQPVRVLVTGGTGLVGSELVRQLSAEGAQVVVLSRSDRPARDGVEYRTWTPEEPGPWMEHVDGVDAVVHLAGKGLFDTRWSEAHLRECTTSRVRSTELLVEAIARSTRRPRVLVSGSAVGYYGRDHGDAWLEEDAPPGPSDDPLVRLCVAWEAAATKAREHNVRVASIRVGIVLGHGGGVLAKMAPAFRFGVGGPLGDGTQYVPWVHVADAAGMIRHAMATDTLDGPCNLAAPAPVTMNELARTFGQVMRRPSLFRVPKFALRALLGEGAEAVLTGQRARPAAMSATGYRFRFAELETALRDLLG